MAIFEGRFPDKGAFMKNPADGTLLFGTGGTFDVVNSFDHSEKNVFFIKDFFTESYLRYAPEKFFRLTQEELHSSLPEKKISFKSLGNEDKLYEDDFRHLLKAFSSKFRKAVMISRESFEADASENVPPYFLKKVLSFGAGIPYGVWGPGFGIMGSTPEELFTLKEGELSTYALAGTAKAGHEEELLNSEKDLLEHRLVVQDIMEKLQRFSDNVSVGELETMKFKDISHLRTDIRAAVAPDVDLSALVSTLSPTAALGGYPKKEGLQFLQTTRYFKKFPERRFGSAMGVVTDEESRFIVMIRNIQWKDETTFIECGGGVVPGSILSKELEEIFWKRNLIKEHYL